MLNFQRQKKSQNKFPSFIHSKSFQLCGRRIFMLKAMSRNRQFMPFQLHKRNDVPVQVHSLNQRFRRSFRGRTIPKSLKAQTKFPDIKSYGNNGSSIQSRIHNKLEESEEFQCQTRGRQCW